MPCLHVYRHPAPLLKKPTYILCFWFVLFFMFFFCWPTPSTLPSKSNSPTGGPSSGLGPRKLELRILAFETAIIGGGEKASLSFDHQYEQNPEIGSRVTCSRSCSWDLIAGNPRLRSSRYEEVAQGLQFLSPNGMSSWKRRTADLGGHEHLNTQKRTWSKLTL